MVIGIGIDVGVSGAVATISPAREPLVTIEDTPTFKVTTTKKTRKGKGQRNEYDLAAMRELLDPYAEWSIGPEDRVLAVLENVHSLGPDKKQRPQDLLRLGYGLAAWRMALVCLGIAHLVVEPAKWKRQFDLLGKPKDASIRLAMGLYPSVVFTRKADHNRAEAVLLARYALLNLDA